MANIRDELRRFGIVQRALRHTGLLHETTVLLTEEMPYVFRHIGWCGCGWHGKKRLSHAVAADDCAIHRGVYLPLPAVELPKVGA